MNVYEIILCVCGAVMAAGVLRALYRIADLEMLSESHGRSIEVVHDRVSKEGGESYREAKHLRGEIEKIKTTVTDLHGAVEKLGNRVGSLDYSLHTKNENLEAVIEKVHGRINSELSVYVDVDSRIKTLTKRLDAVMEEWSTLRVDVEQLQKKAEPEMGDVIMGARVEKLEYRIDKIGQALYQLKAKVDFHIPNRGDLSPFYGQTNAKPPIDEVPNLGE